MKHSLENIKKAKNPAHSPFVSFSAEGKHRQRNRISYQKPKIISPVSQGHVIFFCGDVQQEAKGMTRLRHFAEFSKYSVESTVRILAEKFENYNIWVVQPSQMLDNVYSIYSNFISSENLDEFGSVKSFDSRGTACEHLLALLKFSCKKVHEMTEFQPEFNKAITLLGFSKGAMVLNQLISELSVKLSPFQCESGSDSDYTSSDSEPDEPYSNILFKRVKAIHFLDPGNGPLKGSWVLNHRAIASLVKFPIKMYIHGTKYQWGSKLRPWLLAEKDSFVNRVESEGGVVMAKEYFRANEGSLALHFKLLEDFEPCNG